MDFGVLFHALSSRLTQITDSLSGTVTRTYDNRFDAVATETVPLGADTSTIIYSYAVAAQADTVERADGVCPRLRQLRQLDVAVLEGRLLAGRAAVHEVAALPACPATSVPQ